MEDGRSFGREPGFSSRQQFDGQTPRPIRVDPFIVGSNGRIISQSEPRRRSEPVPGTGRAGRNSGQRNR